MIQFLKLISISIHLETLLFSITAIAIILFGCFLAIKSKVRKLKEELEYCKYQLSQTDSTLYCQKTRIWELEFMVSNPPKYKKGEMTIIGKIECDPIFCAGREHPMWRHSCQPITSENPGRPSTWRYSISNITPLESSSSSSIGIGTIREMYEEELLDKIKLK